MRVMCLKGLLAHIGDREILGGYFSVSSHTHLYLDMTNTRSETQPERPLRVPNGTLNRTYPSPNDRLTRAQQIVFANMEAVENRTKKSRAFQLGISVEEYDQAMFNAMRKRMEAENAVVPEVPEKKLRKIKK